MARRIIVVGCGVAGTTTAFNARKIDRTAHITIVGDENLPEYSRCGLPYAFSGVVSNTRALLGYDEEFYEKTNKVVLRTGWRAKAIDTKQHQLNLVGVASGTEETLGYDSLVICTGALPGVLPIPGANLQGVFTIRTIDDIESLAVHLSSVGAKKTAIIGAGLTGSEMAEALLLKGIHVIQAEIVPEILPVILDHDMATLVRERAEEHGVEYHLGSGVDEIVGRDGKVSAVKISGTKHDVDAVIMTVRVKPNTELAQNAGIKLGELGGIQTDELMQTSAPSVFAAGDCVQTHDRMTKRSILLQLSTTAVRQATVAGVNAAGGSARYRGSTGVTTVKLFDLEVASFGPTTPVAEKLGLHPVSARITGSTRLRYYPGGKDLTVKLVAEQTTGRLLGAQLVGEEGATLRANFASMAGHLGLTAQDLSEIETCYSPPLAPVWDPVTIAAQALTRKLSLAHKMPTAQLGG